MKKLKPHKDMTSKPQPNAGRSAPNLGQKEAEMQKVEAEVQKVSETKLTRMKASPSRSAPGRFIAWCKQEQASIQQQLELIEAGKVDRRESGLGVGRYDRVQALGQVTPRRTRPDARCADRRRCTISGIGRSPVGLPTLVPKTCWYQLSPGRSFSRYAVSLSSTPDIK